MELLSKRQHPEIAKRLKISVQRVEKIVEFISDNLNPFPARSHWGSVRNPSSPDTNVYFRPDVLISFANDDQKLQLIVEIVMPYSGTLQVSPLYKQTIKETDAELKDAMKGDLEKAS
jgi:RNA polymerase sigma-54 factor